MQKKIIIFLELYAEIKINHVTNVQSQASSKTKANGNIIATYCGNAQNINHLLFLVKDEEPI